MISSSIANTCNAIYGVRSSKYEINMNEATKRLKSGKLSYEHSLDNCQRNGKITNKQKNAIQEIFKKTIGGRIGSLWSVSAAAAIHEYSHTTTTPIVGEIRYQGAKNYKRRMFSGRIYFDVSSDERLELLSKMIYEATDLFKTNKNKLIWNDSNDRYLIKAIVLGLYTRPRMADWISVDIQEGGCVEASPRCISESKLKELKEKEKLEEKRNQEKKEQEKRKKIQKEKFRIWVKLFIVHAKQEKSWEDLKNQDVPDNWDD